MTEFNFLVNYIIVSMSQNCIALRPRGLNTDNVMLHGVHSGKSSQSAAHPAGQWWPNHWPVCPPKIAGGEFLAISAFLYCCNATLFCRLRRPLKWISNSYLGQGAESEWHLKACYLWASSWWWNVSLLRDITVFRMDDRFAREQQHWDNKTLSKKKKQKTWGGEK